MQIRCYGMQNGTIMQANFTTFSAPPVLEKKVVNGLELVWSPDDRMFMFPMPQASSLKLLWDEQHGIFKPVPTGEQMLYRERQATAPDGATFRERIIYRDTTQVTARTVEQQKQINRQLRLQWQAEIWETLIAFRPLFIVGLFVGLIAFVWHLVIAVAGAAVLIGQQIGLALAELSYYAAWAGGLFVGALVLKYAIPLAFRSQTDVESTIPTATATGYDAGPGVTINVQQGNGSFGSQSEAQRIVNGRQF